MSYQAQNDQEKIFCNRIHDLIDSVERRKIEKFTPFLDERQQRLAMDQITKIKTVQYSLFGGYQDSQRRVFGVFSEFSQPDEALFPIEAITASFRKQDKISHRDVLGALMGLKINRNAVGDILIGEGVAVFFLLKSVAPLVVEELDKIGRVGVKCALGQPEVLPSGVHFEPIEGTIASFRLDCIVSFLTGLSREKAAKLIQAELVQVNHVPAFSNSISLQESDVISVRGYGKFILSEVGRQTKKGRYHITCLKYS